MNLSTIPSLLLPFFLLSALHAAEWPEWRGPSQQGHALDAANLPVTWSETANVAWKTRIPGRGHSTPVIEGAQIWLLTAHETKAPPAEVKKRLKANTGSQPLTVLEKATFHAVCIDRDSGKIVHDIELFARTNPQWVHKLNSYASPTPILRDGRLYAQFGAFGTACLDTKAAKVLWTNLNLHVMHENGPGGSPVLWQDKLIFHLDGSDDQFIAALDAKTGKLAWKTPRSGEMDSNPQLQKACGTPLLLDVAGRTEVLSPAADWLYAYDPATGKELWKLPYGHLGFSNVARPVAGHGMIYLPTCFMKSKLLAIRYDGASKPKIAWEVTRAMPNQPSPLIVGHEIYTIADRGIASCIDAITGEVYWQERLDGNFSGSPLFADGKIYAGTQDGRMVVFKPGTTLEKLAENTLKGAHMASPVAVGSALYLRTDKALYRIENGENGR